MSNMIFQKLNWPLVKNHRYHCMLQKPNETLACPPGYHVVHAHGRVCQSGTVAWVHAHIRKNRGKINPGLPKENIHYLFWNSKKKYPALNPIDGYIEQRKALIHVRNSDKLDPVVNIALGIRLLGHKYSKIPKGHEKNLYNTIKNYYSWNKGGDSYAKEIFSKYEKSL